MSRFLKLVLPLLAIGGGVLVAGFLIATKPEAPARPRAEREWWVETVPVVFGDVRPELTVYGRIVAGREVELRPLVAGPIREVGDGFVDGGTVEAGDLLVAIDEFDFERDLDERRASRNEAVARLAELIARRDSETALLGEDRSQQELAARDTARYERLAGGAVPEKALDDSRMALSRARSQVLQREQSVAALNAQIDQQRAVVARLDAAVERAERILADTRLTAPFRGHLVDTNAAVGQRVAAGEQIGRLIDADRLEARVYLSDAQFGRVLAAFGGAESGPATVVWRVGQRSFSFPAELDRIDGRIDPAAGGVHAFLRVLAGDEPAPLRVGAFVTVRLPDQSYSEVVALPETALFGRDTVYAVVDGRLDQRRVEVVGHDGARVLVRGDLAEGEGIVTTRINEIGPGLKVKLQ